MQAPLSIKTKMFSLDENAPQLTSKQALTLKNQLAVLAGVVEVAVLPQERTVILKIDAKIHKTQSGDEAQLQKQVQTLIHQL